MLSPRPNASTLAIGGAPVAGSNETFTNGTALNIASSALTRTTNGYGLQVNAPTGATNNYSATFQGGNVGIGTTTPAYPLDVRGAANLAAGLILKRATATSASPYTLSASDYLIAFTSITGPAAVTLPNASAVPVGQMFIVKDESGNASAASPIVITAVSPQKIDGASPIYISSAYTYRHLYSDGSNWHQW